MDLMLALAGLIAFLIIGTMGFIFATVALIKVIAIEKSTHTVQMMPIDEVVDKENKKYMEQWASSEEAIKKQEKMYREEIEDEMPEFALTDEDKESFSI